MESGTRFATIAETHTITRMSVSSLTGEEGDKLSGFYGIATNSTGDYTVFDSHATNLTPNDTNTCMDVFLYGPDHALRYPCHRDQPRRPVRYRCRRNALGGARDLHGTAFQQLPAMIGPTGSQPSRPSRGRCRTETDEEGLGPGPARGPHRFGRDLGRDHSGHRWRNDNSPNQWRGAVYKYDRRDARHTGEYRDHDAAEE